ncbi:beta-propeller fold lactonase family protein [Patescibacteria group bacterium]|nr:beta-propeller fold lactonase family protein [Patescibacteria group bacterium]MBU1673059.1 beta-propeller fold lactonase family protein [Patescibacteria group bacterium]MBU1963665.1 beta-propeller fold lactonase family protein [Patescibacteria group bacterium]
MKKLLFALAFMLILPVAASANYGDTTTFAGKLYGGDGMKKMKAYFDFPQGLDVGKKGTMFIADTENNVIRKINKKNIVSTLAGTGAWGDKDGGRKKARFALPKDVAKSSTGAVFVADTGNNKIKRIKKGKVKTIASGLNSPEGVDTWGTTVYFLDTGNNQLKRVKGKGGTVTTITSSLDNPKKIKINKAGTYAYVTNSGGNQLVKVKLDGGYIQPIAGTGTAGNKGGACLSQAKFRNLWGLSLYEDESGNTDIYVTDGTGNFKSGTPGVGIGYLWQIDTNAPGGCQVNLVASDENMVSLNFPNGIAIHNNNAYIASTGIGIIYRYNLLDPDDNGIYAGEDRFGNKNGNHPLYGRPKDLALSKNKKWVYIAENNKVRKTKFNTKFTKQVAGNVIDNYNKNDNKGYVGGNARFSNVIDIEMAPDGKKLYVVDQFNNRIRYINVKTRTAYYLTGAGAINSLASEDNGSSKGAACPNEFNLGVAGCAYFSRPGGAVLSPDGKYLYVADTGNNKIMRVTTRGNRKGKVKFIAGSTSYGFTDGKGKNARFNAPMGLAISKKGKRLYVADRENHAIRKINLENRTVSTLVGKGKPGYEDGNYSDAVLSLPQKLHLKDKMLYFSEVGSQRVRVVDFQNRVTKLVSGDGNRGFQNGDRDHAQYNNPNGMVKRGKYLYVADSNNDIIRKIDTKGEPPFTDPAPTFAYCSPQSLKFSDYPSGKAMIEVKGSEFRYGAKAWLGNYELPTFVQSDSSLAIEVPIGAMPAGFYQIKVQNSDGQAAYGLRAFAAQEYSGNVPNIDYWAP